MTARSGGRIPPDGRAAQAPGIGKNARRHDLEEPATPGLHGSDLQQGDVSMLEAGQRVAPIRNQPAAASSVRRPRTKAPMPQRGGSQPDVPDPLDFLGERLAGTRTSPDQPTMVGRTTDMHTWLPLLERLATAPGASGIMSQAFITAFANASKRPLIYETPLIDMQDADEDLAALLGG